MTRDEEVRLLELATQLVLGPLADESVEAINALGGWLAQMTKGDREQVEKGERWGKRSRALSQDEARRVLRGLTIVQADAFCDRWDYGRNEVMGWAMGYSEIPHGALVAFGDVDEMAKITGEAR